MLKACFSTVQTFFCFKCVQPNKELAATSANQHPGAIVKTRDNSSPSPVVEEDQTFSDLKRKEAIETNSSQIHRHSGSK